MVRNPIVRTAGAYARANLRKSAAALLGLAWVLAAGCASTQEHRIAQYRGKFAAFPPAVREAVRRGEVRPGFTPLQVYLAHGMPDRNGRFAPPDVEPGDQWTYIGVERDGRFLTTNDPVILPSRGLQQRVITFGESNTVTDITTTGLD